MRKRWHQPVYSIERQKSLIVYNYAHWVLSNIEPTIRHSPSAFRSRSFRTGHARKPAHKHVRASRGWLSSLLVCAKVCRTHLVILVLQIALRRFGPTSKGLCLITGKCPRGVGVVPWREWLATFGEKVARIVQLRTFLVNPSNQ